MPSSLSAERMAELLEKGNPKPEAKKLEVNVASDKAMTSAIERMSAAIKNSNDANIQAVLLMIKSNQALIAAIGKAADHTPPEPKPRAYKHTVIERDDEGNILQIRSDPI